MKIYEDFETALKAKLTAAGSFKTLTWYNEQDENTEDEKAIAYPAVFYNLSPLDWKQLGNGHQSARAVLELTIVANNLQDKPNEIFGLAEAAHAQLSAKALMIDDLQITTPMVRGQSELFGNRFRQLKKARIEYLFELYDHNLNPPLVDTPNAPTLNLVPPTE